MSLIPSESYSFPEDFTRTLAASRKLKNEDPESQPVESQRKKPAVGALPNPRGQPPRAAAVIRENGQPVRKLVPPMPNPTLRRAAAPTPRTSGVYKIAASATLKPKVGWNTRAPAMDPNNGNGAEHFSYEPLMPPAENVTQMTPPPVSPSPVMPRRENLVRHPVPVVGWSKPVPGAPSPKPVSAAKAVQSFQVPTAGENPHSIATSNPQGDFFETFAQSAEAMLSKQRRKAKMRRFVVCESIAFSVLLLLAIIGMWHRPENAALLWILSIFTSAAAVVSAIIPILFFALTPTSSEIEY